MLINIENKLIVKIFDIFTIHIEESDQIKTVITLNNGSVFDFECENAEDAEKSIKDIWHSIQTAKQEWQQRSNP